MKEFNAVKLWLSACMSTHILKASGMFLFYVFNIKMCKADILELGQSVKKKCITYLVIKRTINNCVCMFCRLSTPYLRENKRLKIVAGTVESVYIFFI